MGKFYHRRYFDLTRTFGEMADEMLDGIPYDHAIPQDWAYDVLEKTKINPACHIVWLYDEHGRYFGRPFPLTMLGFIALRLYGYTWDMIPPPMVKRPL